MKAIKVFFNGKKLRDVYPHATKWEVFKWKTGKLIRWTLTRAFVLGLIVGAFQLGQKLPNGEVTYAAVPKIVEVAREAPVLERIATCESHGKHYDSNGQVLINKTQDMGKYQINVPIWGKKATELGYNLAVEKDNKAFAEWLYENYGTEPWVHSKKCWVN